MKKFSLAVSFFALLAASPAFADSNINSTTIEQIGANATAIVKQLGGYNDNTSTITQGNVQDSARNATATVLQDGYGNSAGYDGGNLSTITQDGRNNTADLHQGGSFNDNLSTIEQEGTGFFSENFAKVDQLGYDNINNSTILQTGRDNSATVVQGGISNDHFSTITQSGHGLTSTVTQY